VSNAVLHVRINHIQIDDQLEYSMFPVMFHPIVSKAAGTDIRMFDFNENLNSKKTPPFFCL
jgi:hypothetical protein